MRRLRDHIHRSVKNNKLQFIDALRGLAALYVFFYHFELDASAPAKPPHLFAQFIGYGGSGVALFFMISAFTLSMSGEARQADRYPTLDFYLRRLFRISPLFYVWIGLTCIRDLIVYNAVHPPFELSASVLFFFNFIPGMEQGFVWASWTIGVEMVFYAGFPLLFRMTGTVRSAAIALAVSMLVSWLWSKGVAHYLGSDYPARRFTTNGILNQAPNFMAGILTYRLYTRMPTLEGATRTSIAAACVGLWFGYMVGLTHGWFTISERMKVDTTMLAYGLLILGLSLVPFRMFVNRLTRFAGKISYSVYLSHTTVILLLEPMTKRIYAHLGIGFAFLLASVIALSCIFAFSYLTYCFVEKPGNRAGRYLIERVAMFARRSDARRPSHAQLD
jgi:peptidoglycan/LPS O-acetylase OafA/YrhL